ncbi:MAG: hypothetical protein NTZ44_04305 [Candidatus Nomurabacteria bacterium]|nr:hypothetical protein [Candidatus Nomurabacteria bacterium]
MENLEEKYQSVLKDCTENENIIGFFLGGSRGKSNDFITQNSDMDVYVILSDSAPKEVKEKIEGYLSDWFEIRVLSLTELKNHANWGSSHEWDRYNFAHNKPIIDKTGELTKIMEEKGTLPESVKLLVIKDSLDAYINEVYRSAKYFRDGKDTAGYLDAVESLPFLMTALYALEGRLKPYNKYFEWELKNYPLKFLPFDTDEFIADYLDISRTGNFEKQAKIFKAVKKLFIEQGYKNIFDEWKIYYFVGDEK